MSAAVHGCASRMTVKIVRVTEMRAERRPGAAASRAAAGVRARHIRSARCGLATHGQPLRRRHSLRTRRRRVRRDQVTAEAYMRTEATLGGAAGSAALLQGRTALVTGGANGIGRACAIRLARAGAAVTVVDRDEAGVKEVAELIGGTGGGREPARPGRPRRVGPRRRHSGQQRRLPARGRRSRSSRRGSSPTS